jgi:hypothetical protein
VPAGDESAGVVCAAGDSVVADRGCAVIVLSYAHSGASEVQEALATGTGLVCTSGTGIIALCAAAAETWSRVEGRNRPALSRVAAATIRAMVTAQVTAILASAGQTRWCELAASPSAAETFREVFPHAVFVCAHRSCLDIVRAGIQASPWRLQGQGLTPYLWAYPGNSVAALAAHWANSAERLIAFEETNREVTYRAGPATRTRQCRSFPPRSGATSVGCPGSARCTRSTGRLSGAGAACPQTHPGAHRRGPGHLRAQGVQRGRRHRRRGGVMLGEPTTGRTHHAREVPPCFT